MRTALLALIVVAIMSMTACRSSSPVDRSSSAQPSGSAAALASALAHTGLTLVDDASTVCMVNDRYMGSPQIPVSVSGKTYYGCCEGCRVRLEHDDTARTASDPVTGAPVDKAAAVLARTQNGRVLYFQSEATLRRYAQ